MSTTRFLLAVFVVVFVCVWLHVTGRAVHKWFSHFRSISHLSWWGEGGGKRLLRMRRQGDAGGGDRSREEILTHQLFTCKMVRPVSWASCFFCSSEGYGCCGRGKQRKNKHTHEPLTHTHTLIYINVHTLRKAGKREDKVKSLLLSMTVYYLFNMFLRLLYCVT